MLDNDVMIELLEFGIQLNEYEKQGGNEININTVAFKKLFNDYIDCLYLLEISQDNFTKIFDACTYYKTESEKRYAL